jgi:hypothetical protein
MILLIHNRQRRIMCQFGFAAKNSKSEKSNIPRSSKPALLFTRIAG